eukprot:evm.model.scf_1177.1 EVM.evm.TU.scf_1177.1   scf_1177:22060-24549(-)
MGRGAERRCEAAGSSEDNADEEGVRRGGRRASSSTSSADAAVGDVHLSFEVMSDGTMKLLFRLLYLATLLGLVGTLVGVFALKLSGRMRGIRSTRPLVYVHAVVASSVVVTIWTGIYFFVGRLRAVNDLGLKWSARRRRLVAMVLIETAIVGVIDIFYLAPNLYALGRRCGYFDRVPIWSAFVRYILWGTMMCLYILKARLANLWVDKAGRSLGPREDATLLDAPLWVHWPIGVAWAVYQGVLVAEHVPVARNQARNEHLFPGMCERNVHRCGEEVWVRFMATMVLLIIWCLFLIYAFHLRRAFRQLHRKSYDLYRWEYIRLRYEVNTGAPAFFVGISSHTLLVFVGGGSCFSYVSTIFGYLPLQVGLNALTAINIVWYMPVRPQMENTFSQPIGSRLDWTEADKSARPEASGLGGGFASEGEAKTTWLPSFCFETAVKAYYWCEVAYDYNADAKCAKPPFDLDTAMGLLNLKNWEFVKEELDSIALIAWNQDTIVVSFRGTYSATNLLSDLKVWRVPHHDLRGHSWLGTIPLVHNGFFQTWKTLSRSLIPKLMKIMQSPGFDKSRMRVLLTGHSMGGAISLLAACDFHRILDLRLDQISVYTLGCPRVGNHAFAIEYSKLVPDTWHVVNSVDAIAKLPKLWFLYKHCGHKVVINRLGHLVVRPTFLEMKLTTAFFKSSVPDHLLSSYRKSLAAVARAQFVMKRGLPGGKSGVFELMQKGILTMALGVDASSVAGAEACDHSAQEMQRNCSVERALIIIQLAAQRLNSSLRQYVALLSGKTDDKGQSVSRNGRSLDQNAVEVIAVSVQCEGDNGGKAVQICELESSCKL